MKVGVIKIAQQYRIDSFAYFPWSGKAYGGEWGTLCEAANIREAQKEEGQKRLRDTVRYGPLDTSDT